MASPSSSLKAYESDCDEDLGDDEQLLHRKTWQFYDDLGRPTILAKGGKNLNGTYSVSMTEYDKMGRKVQILLQPSSTKTGTSHWENGAYLRYDYHFLQSFCIERPGKSGDGFVTLYICSFAIDQGNE
jgi:hypothetical protein